MSTRRVDHEFRAAIVKPGLLPHANAAVADPLARFQLPRDTRTLTRGVRGSLRWSQTRLGRNVRPEQRPQADRLVLSDEARNGRRGPSGGQDADLASAQDTLDELLAQLRSRGLSGHPRTRALTQLRERISLERQALARSGRGSNRAASTGPLAEPPFKTAPQQAATDASGGFRAAFADLWDSLLGLIQRPDEKAAHRSAILKEVRESTAKGDRQGATRRLTQLLARDPKDAEAHARLGRLLLDAGELDAAEPHLRQAADNSPRDPARQIALGELHYHRGDPQEALMAFGKALRLQPEHSDTNAWLGILAHEGDRPVEAQRFLERAIAFDPNHVVARFYLAQVSLAQGDKLRADFQLDIVRKLEPTADLARFDSDEPPALPARTGTAAFTGWVVPRAGRLAGSPIA